MAPSQRFLAKRCPFCRVHLALNEVKCFSCGEKIGLLDPKTGFAQKPSRWKNALISILAWLAFLAYMWWVFLKK